MGLNHSFVNINGKKFRLYISDKEIQKKVKEMAQRIQNDYKGKKPFFLIVLKGSIFFASDLLRKIDMECEIETISTKSYGLGMESSGKVEVSITNLDIAGKDVLVIEDIIDTGYTLKALFEVLEKMKPASLEAVTFLSKPAQRKVKFIPKYAGIEIDPEFVIGYGLDYAEQGRNLPEIYILSK
jgi:hypoxanthine phosphoribosyltransferase